jgi:hypothetical protein
VIKTDQIRWRLNEPTEEPRVRWTRVHRVSFHNGDLTRCHMKIPEHPYDAAYNEWIPDDAPRCKRCASIDE